MAYGCYVTVKNLNMEYCSAVRVKDKLYGKKSKLNKIKKKLQHKGYHKEPREVPREKKFWHCQEVILSSAVSLHKLQY